MPKTFLRGRNILLTSYTVPRKWIPDRQTGITLEKNIKMCFGTEKTDFPGKSFHAKAIWLNNTDSTTTCKSTVLSELRARFSEFPKGYS